MNVISILICGLIVKCLLNFYDDIQRNIKQTDKILEILIELQYSVNKNKLKNNINS